MRAVGIKNRTARQVPAHSGAENSEERRGECPLHRLKTYDDLFASHGKVECHFFQLKYEKIKEAHSNTEEDGIRYVLQFHWKVNVKLRRTMSGQYLKLQRTRRERLDDSLFLFFPYFEQLNAVSTSIPVYGKISAEYS